MKNTTEHFNKGRIPWNKGLVGIFKHSEETKKKIGEKSTGKNLVEYVKLNGAWNKGKKMSPEYIEKNRLGHLGITTSSKGIKRSKETRMKLRISHLGKVSWNKGKKFPERSGVNHPNWIEDRSLIKRQDKRDNPEYVNWRKKVWLRDNFTCKIANPDCKGRLEAHHILGFTAYPELRYKINNGITLCHAHHPFSRKEEAELSPFFQQLVAEVN